MRLRALLALFLLLPGCFGPENQDGLAQPTDKTIIPPTPIVTTRAVPAADLTDPGYVTNATWHVGDGWDYQSNGQHYRTVRVVANRTEGHTQLFQTLETEGLLGNAPNLRYSRWIDGTNWTILNQTAERGIVTRFTPPAPERFLRNGSYVFNISSPSDKQEWRANVLYTSRPRVTLPWGEVVTGGRFEHRILVTPQGGTYERVLATHVFSGDYGNDLSYQRGEAAELYQLSAVRYGARAQGTLIVS